MFRRESKQAGMAETLIWTPTKGNETLETIDRVVDWKPLREQMEKLYRKGGPGRPAFPAVTLFKTLLL